MSATAIKPQPVSARLLWFSRIMSWACWFGIAVTLVFPVLNAFGVIPATASTVGPETMIAYSSVALGADAGPNSPAPPELAHDLFFQATRLVPIALTVWALVSARTVFVSIGRGAFFARSTSLGLRNLSLAVLLNMTLAPLLTMAAHVLFAMRMQAKGVHGELSLNLGLSNTTLLILIFSATVAIIASVMAHAARVAEENEQFV